MPRSTLSIRIQDDLRERLVALAGRERRTVSQYTEILLEGAVAQAEDEVIQRLLKEVRNGNND